MKKVLSIGVVSLLVIGGFFGVMDLDFEIENNEKVTQGMQNIADNSETSERRIFGYTPHDPIYIDGNSQFTAVNGVTGGSGTQSDPYIIEGWDISASSTHGIEIHNTNAYFIIRDCYVHDGRSNYKDGIYFHNVTNGQVENTNLSNNYDGIFLDYLTNNNNIYNNSASNNDYGISMWYSNNNNIYNNSASNNYIGILLDSSNNVYNNNASNNWCGIYLYESSYNNIYNNNASNNYYGIFLEYLSNNNNIYNNNASNNYFGIYLDYSSDNNVYNNSVSNNKYGIRLRYECNNNILSDNSISNNNYGIYVYWSSGNNIHNNSILGNAFFALHSTDSGNIDARYNYFGTTDQKQIEKLVYGSVDYSNWLSYRESNVQYINTTVVWTGTVVLDKGVIVNGDLSIEDATLVFANPLYQNFIQVNSDLAILNSTVRSNYGSYTILYLNKTNGSIINSDIKGQLGLSIQSEEGISIQKSNLTYGHHSIVINKGKNVMIKSCNISNNNYSIHLYSSSYNNISNNNINSNNGDYGIYLVSSSNNNISNNNASNYNYGIYLYSSSYNNISNNNASNNEYGIWLKKSKNNILSNNTANSNVYDGIHLDYYSSHNNIYNNNANSNRHIGIDSSGSNNNISNNSASNNKYGIYLGFGNNNVSNNSASNNTNYGIYLSYSCNNNNIYNNSASNNGCSIYMYYSSNNNIYNNNVSNNYYSICLQGSSNTFVSNNISYNSCSIEIYDGYCKNNIFHHNSFFNGSVVTVIDNGANTKWDDGYGEGNYWSDYTGLDDGSNGRIAGDGIGDTDIPHMGLDNYPLMEPVEQPYIPDTTPPVISSVIVSGITENSATITWVTDENSDSRINYSINSDLSFNSTEYDPTMTTSHSITLTGLSPETTYYFKVSSADKYGNTATDNNNSNYYRFITLEDITPPIISSVSVSGITENSATITWVTDENSDSRVNYSINADLSSNSTEYNSTPTTSHSITLNGLSRGTTYYFEVSSTDSYGNTATDTNNSNYYRFTILDTTPPIILFVAVSGVTENSATITWTTDEFSDSRVNYSVNADLSSNFTKYDPTMTTSHSITLTGLSPGTTYYFEVSSTDNYSNTATDTNNSNYYRFTTLEDITPPIISSVSVSGITENSATITWVTDENSDSRINYSINSDLSFNSTKYDSTMITSHSITLTGLNRSITYYFELASADKYGNTATDTNNSNYYRFTTLEDITPPVISSVSVSDVTANSATITWITDEPSDSRVNYSVNADLSSNFTKYDPTMTTSHSITLTGLSPGTTYYFEVSSTDGSSNTATDTNSSNYYKFTTSEEDTTPPATPTGLMVTDVPSDEGNALNITWDPNIELDLDHYTLYSKKTGVWTILVSISAGTEHYVDTGLTSGIIYYYKISATDNALVPNESPLSSAAYGIPTDNLPPATPTGLEVTSLHNGDLNITWNINTDDTQIYSIYSNKTGTWALLANVTHPQHWYVDTGLTSGTTYYYKISAWDEVPLESSKSGVVQGFSSPVGTISGTVKDKDGNPVEGATITIFEGGTTTDPVTSTTTNGNGEYSVNIPPGMYDVKIEKSGYDVQWKKDVEVTADQTTTTDSTLPMISPPTTDILRDYWWLILLIVIIIVIIIVTSIVKKKKPDEKTEGGESRKT